ncbi:hypothetical protein O181_100038 [Austropuccinia psidii MF-1]|uniref:Uncharacterized protein n=1 Tax=Austropuccinia psidii MF-1 TaxID=1389203 RepID=A0A9Q3JDW5_9BASI|nr:hypothetical protein [Austropuccinia psidii MF-1]
MNHNQIKTGLNRSRTPNSYKNSFKKSIYRELDCSVRLYSRKYSKSATWTLELKNPDKINPENSNSSTGNIMAHPALRRFNKQETSQITHMSGSLLMPRKIQSQFFSHKDPERPVIPQYIYNQVQKIKKDKLQGRRPIDNLIDTLKEEKFVWSSARDNEGHINSFFSLASLPQI